MPYIPPRSVSVSSNLPSSFSSLKQTTPPASQGPVLAPALVSTVTRSRAINTSEIGPTSPALDMSPSKTNGESGRPSQSQSQSQSTPVSRAMTPTASPSPGPAPALSPTLRSGGIPRKPIPAYLTHSTSLHGHSNRTGSANELVIPDAPLVRSARGGPPPPPRPRRATSERKERLPSGDSTISLPQPHTTKQDHNHVDISGNSGPAHDVERRGRPGTFEKLDQPIPAFGTPRSQSQSQTPDKGVRHTYVHPSTPAGEPEDSPSPTKSHYKTRPPSRLVIDRPLPPLPAEAATPATFVRGHHNSDSTSSTADPQITTPQTATLHPLELPSPRSAKFSTTSSSNSKGWKAKWRSATGGSDQPPIISERKSSHLAVDDEGKITSDQNGGDEDDKIFSVDRILSKRVLWEAGTSFLRDEDGGLVCFGDLFPRVQPGPASSEKAEGEVVKPMPKTVIFFIRHFWCGQCQDFMFASISQLDPVALEKDNIKVVIISNGSWKILKAYKKLFNCPFPIYVDGPRKLYQLLGMTKMTNDFGPWFKGRAAYHQRAVPGQLLNGGKNAITKMPFAYPGKLTQLGGEFILSPGYTCDFAHRMTNTSNHMEAPDVLRLAGCEHPTKAETVQVELLESQRLEVQRLEGEMKAWREQTERELDNIRRRKAERRGEAYTPATPVPNPHPDPRDSLSPSFAFGPNGGEGEEWDEQERELQYRLYAEAGVDEEEELGKREMDERFRKAMEEEGIIDVLTQDGHDDFATPIPDRESHHSIDFGKPHGNGNGLSVTVDQ